MYYWTALLLGLGGSLHCVGMCGPLMLRIGAGQGATGAWAYQGGRVLTYGYLGAAVGLLGAGAQSLLAGARLQQMLSVTAGVLMIALTVLTLTGRHLNTGNLGGLRPWVQRQLGRLMSGRPTPLRSLGMGMLNGLLPCGLVYAALAGALGAGSPAGGVLYMLLFGLGTTPALLALMTFGTKLGGPRYRPALRVLTLAAGLLLVVRGLGLGIPYLSPKPPKNLLSTSVAHHCAPPPSELEQAQCRATPLQYGPALADTAQ